MEGKTRTQNNKEKKKGLRKKRDSDTKTCDKVLGKAMHFVLSCVGDGRFC